MSRPEEQNRLGVSGDYTSQVCVEDGDFARSLPDGEKQ